MPSWLSERSNVTTPARNLSGERAVTLPCGNTDESDALRLIEASIVLAALPTIVSQAARDTAAIHLRGVIDRTPGADPLLHHIVRHLENPGSE